MLKRGLNQSLRLISTNSQQSSATIEVVDKKEAYYKQQNTKNHEDQKLPPEWYTAKPFESIPGPKPAPVIGNSWRFLFGKYKDLDLKQIYQLLNDEFGDIVLLQGLAGLRNKVFLFNPEEIVKMHRNEGIWPIREALHSIKYFRENVRNDIFGINLGLTAMQGEDWFKFRSVVNPILMQPRTATQYIGNMDSVANDFLRKIDKLYAQNPELPEDFENEINKWTLESVAYLALDKRFGCLDENISPKSQELIDSTIGTFRQIYKLDVLPSLWKIYPTKDWKLFKKYQNFLVNYLMEEIEEAVEKIKKRKVPLDPTEKSIFENFLEMDKRIAVVMAIDMITAGVDTTSKTMAAALYFLAKNKQSQTRLREELISLMPSKDSPVDKKVLANAKYLKACIKESSRLAPIAAGNLRTTVKETVLAGYQIPKDIDLLSANIVLTTSDKYFPKANEFIPERYLRTTEDEMSFKNAHPFVSIPFGFGPRSCVGKRLANLELEVGLSKIIRNYYLDWPHKDMRFSSTLIYGTADPLRYHLKAVEK